MFKDSGLKTVFAALICLLCLLIIFTTTIIFFVYRMQLKVADGSGTSTDTIIAKINHKGFYKPKAIIKYILLIRYIIHVWIFGFFTYIYQPIVVLVSRLCNVK